MCTRVLWNTNQHAVLVGRSMDWPVSTEPRLMVLPRGQVRDGGSVAGERVTDNGLTWTSRYGSIITSIYGIGTADGMNERGLAVHMLFLSATDFGDGHGTPGVHAGLWAQYLLDCAADVGEALALLEDIHIVMVGVHGYEATVHMALEDASGDSAIVEYVDGRRVVHHGPQYTIMTNDPTYDEQLQLLASQDFSQPSRDMPLPGNVNARDRFQRAAYYLSMLPEPADERQAVAGVLAIARNVSVPFGAPYGEFGVYNTEYRTVANLTERRYFFELSTSPNVLWASLDRFDLADGAPALELDPDDLTLAGEVSDRFRAMNAPPF